MIRLYPAQPIEIEEIREMLIRIWWDTYRNLLPDELIQEAIDKWFGADGLLQQISDQKYFFYLVKDDLNRLAGLVTATMV